MSENPRYRVENGEPTIDIRIANVEQMFDNRDPAPFRERDLDPDLVEYLMAAGEDLTPQGAFRVAFWIEKPCQPHEIEDAFHAHFEYELDRLHRRRARHRRTGMIALAIAVTLVVVLLALARLVATAIPGSLGVALKEGLVISSWVVMWRPIEILIYDWIPVWRERKVMSALLRAPIDVRTGKGPEVEAGPKKPA